MKYKLFALICGIALAAGCGGNSTESTTANPAENNVVESEPKKSDATIKFELLSKKFDSAMKEFRTAYSEAKEEERSQLYKDLYPKPEEYAAEFMEIAQSDPKTPAAAEALCWVATRSRGDQADQAIETLFADHIENVEMKQICSTLMYGDPSKKTEDRLQLLIDKSPHEEVKGQATYFLAKYLMRIPRTIQYIEENPSAASRFSEETVAYLESFDMDDARVKSLFQSAIDNYGDIEMNNRTVASMAESAIFELENLAIGMVAPDIEGTDLDGTEFKLSDYRCKVVVLDFWGDW